MEKKFDYKVFIIIVLLIAIVGILLRFTVFEGDDSSEHSSKNSSSKSRDSEEDDESEDEDEVIELIDDWIAAQKAKNINKLMKIIDPIASEALIKSISQKGSKYTITDFEDN